MVTFRKRSKRKSERCFCACQVKTRFQQPASSRMSVRPLTAYAAETAAFVIILPINLCALRNTSGSRFRLRATTFSTRRLSSLQSWKKDVWISSKCFDGHFCRTQTNIRTQQNTTEEGSRDSSIKLSKTCTSAFKQITWVRLVWTL